MNQIHLSVFHSVEFNSSVTHHDTLQLQDADPTTIQEFCSKLQTSENNTTVIHSREGSLGLPPDKNLTSILTTMISGVNSSVSQSGGESSDMKADITPHSTSVVSPALNF